MRGKYWSENSELEQVPSSLMGGFGSNCWAVHGKHTKSGQPILACDPHLFKFTNSQWTFAHLKWKDNYQIGACVPGMFTFSHSRTKYNSYGVTSMNADGIDIYVEKVKDGKYLFEGEWVPLQPRIEKFYVRGQGWYDHEYQDTRNGVLIHEQKGEAKRVHVWLDPEVLNVEKTKPGEPELRYSMRWS